MPTAVAAAAAWSVAIGDDDAGGCGHVTVSMTRLMTAMIDNEDRVMRANEHGTVARRSASTALERRLYLQPPFTAALKNSVSP